ncbi:MAG: type III secretion system export apparatus subunit SctV [Gammaproteobacteria bacterium]
MGIIKKISNLLALRSDLLFALVLISIVLMMILPIPTYIVDIVIAINLATAVVLLMVGVYIPTPIAFSAFPTILLITTLFRLSLSVTTTRLILVDADAGEIIYAFGDFVVAGSMIVGLVVFLIITIVSFVVVTKGSERIAEVSARFSLDGMPGKQMSIDSDMRAGLITMVKAKKRRSDLEQENRLYGAMDGAMKFVKGDAIAGLIIIFVNIIGGLSVGIFQHGMEASEALQIYSILTIGDGLVSQIPALIIAVTAGVIVTRVTSEEGNSLGEDIGGQITAYPHALLIGAALLFCFAWIPGFPTVTFICLSALLGFLGIKLQSRFSSESGNTLDNEQVMTLQGGGVSSPKEVTQEKAWANTSIILEISPSLKGMINISNLDSEIANIRKDLQADIGIAYPGVHLRFNSDLSDDHYSILLYDVPVTTSSLRPDALLTTTDPALLEQEGISYLPETYEMPRTKGHWVLKNDLENHTELSINLISIEQVITNQLRYELQRNAAQFVGIQETYHVLAQVEPVYSELIKEVFRHMSISKIAEVFRRLVSENVSITNLRTILESLVEWGPQIEDMEELTEQVRINLKSQISHQYSNNKVLPVYLLDPGTEEKLRNSIRQTPQGVNLALEVDESKTFLGAIADLINGSDRKGNVALITTVDLRCHIRKLTELEFHDLPILSFQELAPQVTVQPLGKISL